MTTQEEYTDLLALSRQGKTIVEIADELDYHPATIAKWLKDGGPPPKRTIEPAAVHPRRGGVRSWGHRPNQARTARHWAT